ncbi:bidirectional sugar transporter SWEET2 [Rhodamnia argentea]|uniref:Bidirectional sugar transporter SWEET n=1 Tax=Rhodamnia argentea TaxID=178133 RepID=A0A8B8NSY4_9MYRT|nr:bidirectional sugar transporter SWEET2 [Rhodamnia argentea]XP_048130197.1 bidirectional sugar transporter SWEET2 [Rhodamnia argentea]XP_048130198.1 bidirectional sugar transporter SWEET2 [Rhodamnia argentea]XP_048130199.1 bidirectional sugar transporter SWEET2 [Rhodamnia argentea]
MIDLYSLSVSVSTICKDAAGAAGNIFAIGVFVSPIPTFRRIVRNQSTEQFSGLPYIYALLNCLLCTWYGTPLISSDNMLVMTVNSAGALFQLAYIVLYVTYADKQKKVMMLGFLSAVLVIFAIVVIGSLQIVDDDLRRDVVGIISGVSLISMLASPLLIINLVIRTKSVEFMPFYLSLSMFLMSASFFLYGIFNNDIFIYVPNGIGTILGITQLVLYCYYKRTDSESSREPLIESYAETV